MKEWKWSNGTICERSPRISKQYNDNSNNNNNIDSDNTIDINSQINIPQITTSSVTMDSVLNENQAYIQSLELDVFRENNTKREDSWEKMATRDLIGQIGTNPFFGLQQQNDYVKDVSIRDEFMKPISTIMDMVKLNEIE